MTDTTIKCAYCGDDDGVLFDQEQAEWICVDPVPLPWWPPATAEDGPLWYCSWRCRDAHLAAWRREQAHAALDGHVGRYATDSPWRRVDADPPPYPLCVGDRVTVRTQRGRVDVVVREIEDDVSAGLTWMREDGSDPPILEPSDSWRWVVRAGMRVVAPGAGTGLLSLAERIRLALRCVDPAPAAADEDPSGVAAALARIVGEVAQALAGTPVEYLDDPMARAVARMAADLTQVCASEHDPDDGSACAACSILREGRDAARVHMPEADDEGGDS